MIPADEAILKKMFHWSEIPPAVEEEYDQRLGMLHRSGSNGPLGAVGLIDMTRFLGCAPPATAKAVAKTDWRSIPRDGCAQVTAKWRGEWCAGVYVGPAPSGALAVRLANDEVVREFMKKDVTLVQVTDVPEPLDDEPQEDDALPETLLPVGETVLVELDGDVVEAELIEPDDGEGALVLVDGEQRRVPQDQIVSEGEVSGCDS